MRDFWDRQSRVLQIALVIYAILLLGLSLWAGWTLLHIGDA